MGNALVVMTVPEEAWMIPLGQLGEDRKPKPDGPYRRRAISLPVEPGDVWEPPLEPTAEYGLHWYEHPEARRAHREAVRRSLETFLNEHLARLYFMLRTGWWVLGTVRVRVVECRPVPEREMRQFAGSLRNAASTGRRRPAGNRLARKRGR